MDDSKKLASSTQDRIEIFGYNGTTLGMIIRAGPVPTLTKFYTPTDFIVQVGNVVHSAGIEIPRHKHRRAIQMVYGTPEVLLVQKGRMIVNLYGDDYAFLCTREVTVGDVLVLLSGGHGFRFLEDTVLLEVKKGPYGGHEEKEQF